MRSTRAAARRDRSLVLTLLACAASRGSTAHGWPTDQEQDAFDDWQLRWVMRAGLGPLLYHFLTRRVLQVPAVWHEFLHAADLTAQVRQACLTLAATEVIDVCKDLDVSPVLLKGISISETHYPAMHLRPMGDIDVLIPETAYAQVERALLTLGYQREPGHEVLAGACHGVPLYRAARPAWVELHTDLFPASSPLRQNGLFTSGQLQARCVASAFQGRTVRRLCIELQLAYVAAAWVRDLTRLDAHPSFLPPLFDLVYLVNDSTMNWQRLLVMLDNELAAASVYLAISYLSRLGLCRIPSRVLVDLRGRQSIVGPLEIATLHRVLDRTLVATRPVAPLLPSWHLWNNLVRPGPRVAKLLSLPWRIVFPPSRPDRYHLTYQRGRLRRLIGPRAL